MKRTKEFVFAFFFGLAVAIGVYTASQTVMYWPFLNIQNKIDDSHFFRRFMFRGADGHKTDDIVIVDIDDKTLESYKAVYGDFKNWPRSLFAWIIRDINRDGARLVFLDAILVGQNLTNDVLAELIKNADNVIAGYYFNLYARSKNHRPLDPVYNERFFENWIGPRYLGKKDFIVAKQIVFPYYQLTFSAKSLGFTNYVPDPDGILRHIPLYIKYRDRLYPSVGLQIWRHIKGLHHSEAANSSNGIRFGDTFIPTDKHCFMRLNFIASQPVYPTVSFEDVLEGRFKENTFRNKIVMIGSSSVKLGDLKRIPGYNKLPGVEIHATAVSNLLNEKFLTVLSGNTVFVITLVCGVFSSLLFSFVPPIKVGMPLAVCIPLAFYIYAIYSFITQSKLINISIPSFVILLLYIVIVIHRFVEKEEKKGVSNRVSEVST
ncbi:CHASE2 domain-containing protein [Candidatus Latescibacterota bacterium]